MCIASRSLIHNINAEMLLVHSTDWHRTWWLFIFFSVDSFSLSKTSVDLHFYPTYLSEACTENNCSQDLKRKYYAFQK